LQREASHAIRGSEKRLAGFYYVPERLVVPVFRQFVLGLQHQQFRQLLALQI